MEVVVRHVPVEDDVTVLQVLEARFGFACALVTLVHEGLEQNLTMLRGNQRVCLAVD